jgi:hypothetical protein
MPAQQSPRPSARCPQKILFIAEELFASPLGQSSIVAEIVVPKIPQQIPATPLIICFVPPNAQQIEMRQSANRPEPARPWQIGFNEPKPAEPSRVVVRIFDLPTFRITFGDFDRSGPFDKLCGLITESAFEYALAHRPENPISIRQNYLGKCLTGVLTKIQGYPPH